MTDRIQYCDNTYKRRVRLKAGLSDLISQAEEMQEVQHIQAAKLQETGPEPAPCFRTHRK